MQHIDLQNNFHVLMEAAVSKQQPKKRLITMSQETIKNLREEQKSIFANSAPSEVEEREEGPHRPRA